MKIRKTLRHFKLTMETYYKYDGGFLGLMRRLQPFHRISGQMFFMLPNFDFQHGSFSFKSINKFKN